MLMQFQYSKGSNWCAHHHKNKCNINLFVPKSIFQAVITSKNEGELVFET